MRILKNPDGPAQHLEFSADSRWLMVSGGQLRVWEVASWGERLVLRTGVRAARMADGGRAAVLYNERWGNLNVIGLPDGEALAAATFSGVCFGRMAVSGKAGRLVVADSSSRVIHSWRWPGLEPLPPQSLPHGGDLGRLADLQYSPEGRHLAVIDRGPRVALRTPDGAAVWEKAVTGRNYYGRLAWSPDGRFLAAASGIHLNILDPAKGETVANLRLKLKYYQDIAFTADGRFLAAVSNEKTVKVYETASWALRHELAWEIGPLKALAFSPDGMLGAVGSGGKKVLVWDIDW